MNTSEYELISRMLFRSYSSWQHTWEDGLDIPHDCQVDGRINQHHPHATGQAELILRNGTRPNVRPLQANTLFLIASNVAAAEAKSNSRGEALKHSIYQHLL